MLAHALAALLWFAVPTPTPVPAQTAPNAFALARTADQAYRAGDMAGFLSGYEEAVRLRPGNTRLLYNLACAQARNGQASASLATLRDLTAHRAWADLAADTDFDSIRKEKGYDELVAKMAALRQERCTSGAVPAFTIPEKALVPEGVAYDPVTKAFFVASVNKGKILKIGPDGKASDFATPGTGLRSPLGMGVDAKRRALWVADEVIPNMNGGKEGDAPDSALFELDLDTGRLRGKHVPPASPHPPSFDDLTVAADGRVYVNDGQASRIYALQPGHELAVWLESDALGGT